MGSLEDGWREEWRGTVEIAKKVSDNGRISTGKDSYETPCLIEHGSVAKMTGKPSTRSDGSMGSLGDKGQGS